MDPAACKVEVDRILPGLGGKLAWLRIYLLAPICIALMNLWSLTRASETATIHPVAASRLRDVCPLSDLYRLLAPSAVPDPGTGRRAILGCVEVAALLEEMCEDF